MVLNSGKAGSRSRLHLIASRGHKWLALFVGAQLLIWFSSGALMSFLPIEKVRGEHLVDRAIVKPLPHTMKLVDSNRLVVSADGPVEAITYHMLGNRPVAELKTSRGTRLFDAETGAAIEPVGADQATAIALAAWRGASKPSTTIMRVAEESPEYRGELPAWRVLFADPDNTAVYVVAGNGRISAVRTGTWRLYDFFWGLHIMDWKNHENFNTPWLLGFAIGGFVLGLFGSILLFLRWPGRRGRPS
jgi:hypothetical protein